PTLNGIDYLEICSTEPGCDCGKLLNLIFLKDVRSLNLSTPQIKLTGGASNLAQVKIVTLHPVSGDNPKLLTIELDQPGDFSTYTLTLIADAVTLDPPVGIDPQLATIDFSFKANCQTVGDCLPTTCCPPEQHVEPDINYLAKDYESFRQVILDRMAVLSPTWNEPHASDTGIALVETIAYLADHLSYQQDATATEAYIGTARSRISMRRHAKLVDYQMSDGSNARTWVYFHVKGDLALPAGTRVFPSIPGLPASVSPNSSTAKLLMNNSNLAFATMQDALLYEDQNKIYVYTWSDTNCCLAPGATQATLLGTHQSLQPGSVLLFEEVLGPNTGNAEDADPQKRWAVRLTAVQTLDFQNQVLVDPLNQEAITNIWWAAEDALPFPLCISSTTDTPHGSHPVINVSVAWGNIVPADHGTWLDWEDLGEVPPAPESPIATASCACGSSTSAQQTLPRFFPQLSNRPLTFAYPLDATASASTLLTPSSSASSNPIPQLQVQDDQLHNWPILTDLLSTPATSRGVVPEIESDNTVFLRFGDGQYGMAAETGADFRAKYRIGNGTTGNIGRDTLGHVLTNVIGITQVRNPIAAAGGVDPESMTHIRQQAPFAFRSQRRAVTEDDYATMTEQDPAIFEAKGTMRWTGSWYTAFVSVDARSGSGPTPALIASTKQRLNLLRMAGVDLEVEGAILVGLRITMQICVDARHFQSDVRNALLRLFISGDQCNGKPGILNPQNFTFGQTIYTSPLIAAAQAVEGVSSVTLATFQRMDDPSSDGTASGYLTMGRLEIARCDNDPNRLDHGLFSLNLDGGK
ncbi:MAG TPA: baseplate J/gp47 family protein, partial [Edaphobacter sp.]